MSDDPLDELFKDGEALDRALLAAIIKPNAVIHKDRNGFEIRLTPEGEKLSARQKILIYLLAKKVIALKDGTNQMSESAAPADIEKETGIAGGTLRPTLRRLLDENLVVQDTNGSRYRVPNHAINRISHIISSKG